MNVVDSSGWLEYFADGPNAQEFAPVVSDAGNLIVPSITIFEVFKRIRAQRDSEVALRAASQMRRGRLVDLDADLAIVAADVSADLRLPLTDSVIQATARTEGATVWTQDSDFDGLDDVEYRPHRG